MDFYRFQVSHVQDIMSITILCVRTVPHYCVSKYFIHKFDPSDIYLFIHFDYLEKVRYFLNMGCFEQTKVTQNLGVPGC